ncbi:probable chitinase 2 [Cephus cinctus]|uniref:chitinase n=1 Tax=Cephus cinctus TaxID=211228 RepID=A0AAJ7FCK0_CEPCN|nr:probable chitinase 2 [Cephus cinctus]
MNLSVIMCIMTTLLGPALGEVMICYFGSWATYRPGRGNFQVSNIDPSLCTHYIYAFIGAAANGDIFSLDPWNDLPDNGGKNNIGKFVALKNTKTAPKVLAGIGGWNAASTNFTIIVNNRHYREKFVKNLITFLEKYNFDGLDVAWDYPAQNGGRPADRKTFIVFANEVKAAFVKKGLLVTVAVGAAEDLAIPSYEIAALSKAVDYINVMTFDMVGATFSTIVGHHAPLAPASYQANSSRLMHNNVKSSLSFWMKRGAPASKLVLGLPLYGRTFTLAHVTLTTPGSPSAGPGHPGPYTREAGSMGFNELCNKQKGGNWTTVWYKEQSVPYAFRGSQWVGFDNTRSLTTKINYAKKLGLAGIMFWSIETDDFTGNCGHGRYPLLRASKKALNSITTSEGDEDDGQD